MIIIVKDTSTIAEYKFRKQRTQELADLAYQWHKIVSEEWDKGVPTKAFFTPDDFIIVEYENGEQWQYKDLNLPIPLRYKLNDFFNGDEMKSFHNMTICQM